MPSLADMTIKKYDGTTDVVYVGKVASSGDGSPAIYRLDAFAAAAAFRPELKVWSRFNGDKTVRRIEAGFVYPQLYTETTTSLSKVANRARAGVWWTAPMEMPTTDLNEFTAQFANLMDHVQMIDTVRYGFAAT